MALNDPFHRFEAECIEETSGVSTPAGEPWTAWLAWCAKEGIPAGSQKAFGTKMKSRFAWGPNNNRPRYLNLRVKKAAPKRASSAEFASARLHTLGSDRACDDGGGQ